MMSVGLVWFNVLRAGWMVMRVSWGKFIRKGLMMEKMARASHFIPLLNLLGETNNP